MVWTVVLEKKEKDSKQIISVIFEGEHDASSAYRSFLKRSKSFMENGSVIVMIPGRHNYVYFPKQDNEVTEDRSTHWAT